MFDDNVILLRSGKSGTLTSLRANVGGRLRSVGGCLGAVAPSLLPPAVAHAVDKVARFLEVLRALILNALAVDPPPARIARAFGAGMPEQRGRQARQAGNVQRTHTCVLHLMDQCILSVLT